MAKIAFNKHKTDFPPWSVAFDGRGYLYVGGGGGDQREVPNKLIVLDVSSRQQVEQVAELQVSSDSISSLDVLATAPDQSVVYGAVNSSASDKGNGINEHLRAYQVKLPARRKNSEKVQEIGEIKEVSKTCLFSQSYAQSKDGFQRITKLSRSVRSKNGDRSTRKRLLALASSLSNISEILITRGTTVAPTASDVVLKWSPIQNREANDLDLIDGDEPGQYNFLLCTNHEIYFLPLSLDPETLKPKAPLTEPVCVWTSPIPDYYEKRSIRPKYRSIQFLSSDLVCLLANVGSGSELQVLRLFNLSKAEIILRKKLPRAAGQAVSMNVSWLDEDVTGYQVVITVAAQKSEYVSFACIVQSVLT
jgi:prolactin regulatory element-binding protein